MTPEKTYLSQEKFEALKKELAHLTTVRRREVAEKLEYAKSLGDLSENSEYQEAREDQASVEERIAKVEYIIRSAEIVSHESGDTVSIGSKVTLKREGGGEEIYEIVGEEESDIAQKRISNRSPIGVAVIGKKKGDEVIARTPVGEKHYKITRVE
ncbi:MAG: transcription elongation factor GreA [Candidatus Lloydbacteria bacterium RIFCSPHIGHO2_02_FULL_51_22]|uniref:Transcription elongation factor GreA n=3 Tax=Candidatus Lloydiibacteriota TaxID=1817910 RepID=A0A1G2DBU5_9BACT|nr:MAG: transcription elongation factor GreA [Candidatus Lloydbacteria bacterium RIFCSPHIGHO2_02_FULL_51_22]OGZ14359.1 MAG: transcription elongation factor GreA [Candidatus Lloydbacteria bacterium RIFCSPLOWO2_02_FULL_51_11]OGZ16635.1 MAG: transcription elongation factor GreA [Candidatus Lloydbacteria bacterium RIFCSPLOWO2_12_FULL_51_9]